MNSNRWTLTIAAIALATLRAPAQTYTTIDSPGSTGTYPIAINRAGAIAGTYADAGNVDHGFLRDASGAFTSFDAPGSIHTSAEGVNDAGVIAGTYTDADQNIHGLVRTPDGTITVFDVPGSDNTVPFAIDNAGTIAGSFGPAATPNAFIRRRDGTIHTTRYRGDETVPSSQTKGLRPVRHV